MIGALLLTLVTQAPAIPREVVTVVEPEGLRVAAGGRAEVRLAATIAEGFRIQANPAAEPYLVPATLELDADARLLVGPIMYPPGRPHRLRGADHDLSIYEGKLILHIPIEAAPSASGEGAAVVLEGRLRYQACNDVVCLRPASVTVRVPVRIEPAPSAP